MKKVFFGLVIFIMSVQSLILTKLALIGGIKSALLGGLSGGGGVDAQQKANAEAQARAQAEAEARARA
jgi:hypothetical protein